MSSDIYNEEGYYAVIPEWVLESDVSAQAIRLYAVLRRHADKNTMDAHPSRKRLAEKIHVKDEKTVDRALADLERVGAVSIFSRYKNEDGQIAYCWSKEFNEQTSNGYVIRRVPPVNIGEGGDIDAPHPGGKFATHREAPNGDKPQSSNTQSSEPQTTLRSRQNSRGSRVPENFAPTAEMIEWARVEAPNSGKRDHDSFMDYWQSTPGAKGLKLDWVKTWQNWMRKASDDRQRGPRPGSQKRPQPAEQMLNILELGAQMKAEQQSANETRSITDGN